MNLKNLSFSGGWPCHRHPDHLQRPFRGRRLLFPILRREARIHGKETGNVEKGLNLRISMIRKTPECRHYIHGRHEKMFHFLQNFLASIWPFSGPSVLTCGWPFWSLPRSSPSPTGSWPRSWSEKTTTLPHSEGSPLTSAKYCLHRVSKSWPNTSVHTVHNFFLNKAFLVGLQHGRSRPRWPLGHSSVWWSALVKII